MLKKHTILYFDVTAIFFSVLSNKRHKEKRRYFLHNAA